MHVIGSIVGGVTASQNISIYICTFYDLTLYMQIFMFDKRAFFFYLDFAAYLNSDVKIINVELF